MFFQLLVVLVIIAVLTHGREIPGYKSLGLEWKLASVPVESTKPLTLKLALIPRDAQLLERTLLEISTPGSARFRQYLNKQQIAEIVGRSDEDLSQVISWLKENGAKDIVVNPHKDWIISSATAEQTEKMFSCQLGLFNNTRSGDQKVAAKGSYHIPDSLSHIINLVSGMNTFSASRWEALGSSLSTSTSAVAPVTPDTIYQMYQTPTSGSHGTMKGSQAVVEFGSTANFNYADLQKFFSVYTPSLSGEVCTMAFGDNNGSIKPSVEANLDVEYIMAVGVYVNTTDYKITSSNIGATDIEDQFLDYTILVNGQNDPPLVHSISYGKYGGTYNNATDQQFSLELQKMGVAGISVLLASGDNGVGCNTAGTSQEFDYPSSPYITMVGATYLDSISNKEVGATLSSGGFSKDFMQASWQASAVNSYFNSGVTMPTEDYYAPGRAYPDVAAFGQNVMIVSSSAVSAVSGTSCSAPIFAGVVALLNDELLKAGKAPLGFLNPWMYANPQMFTDVTSGSNPYKGCQGFQAAPGWDPVTGLGTPVYPKMRTAAFA